MVNVESAPKSVISRLFVDGKLTTLGPGDMILYDYHSGLLQFGRLGGYRLILGQPSGDDKILVGPLESDHLFQIVLLVANLSGLRVARGREDTGKYWIYRFC